MAKSKAKRGAEVRYVCHNRDKGCAVEIVCEGHAPLCPCCSTITGVRMIPAPASFVVRYVNHGHSHPETFATVQDAIDHAKRTGFEAAIQRVGGNVVAGWGPFSGVTYYGEAK